MIKSYNKLILSGILSSILITSANASDLEIKNQSSGEVTVVIEGGGGKLGPNKEAIKQVLKSGGTLTQKVEMETFGLDTFSITGKAKVMVSTDNKCGPLSIDKNYTILLIEGKAGMITCQAEESK